MEITSISGRDVSLIYSPTETDAVVGTAFAVRELPDRTRGVVVQVIENSTLDLEGFLVGQVQTLLEKAAAGTRTIYDGEEGGGAVQQLKVAACKIRARLDGDRWMDFNGWVPGRGAEITPVGSEELLAHVVRLPQVPMRQFASYGQSAVEFDGARLGQCTLLVGNKSRGKSHILKQITLGLLEHRVPVVIWDMNYEYRLPGFQVMRLGRNYKISLSESGPSVIETLVGMIAPLLPGSSSETTLSTRLPQLFRKRRQECAEERVPYTIDLPWLRRQHWSEHDMVQAAVVNRFRQLGELDIFADEVEEGQPSQDTIAAAYEVACEEGRPIVFEMLPLQPSVRQALFRATMQTLERICERERADGTERTPQILMDEAHFYASESVLTNAVTRSRHVGWGMCLATNSPDLIPNVVLRLLDNLIVLPTSHEDDVRLISKAAASFCDKVTVESLIRSLPDRHAIIMGDLTNRWPLVVEVGPLPDHIPPSGVTRSPWTRLIQAS